MSDNECDYYLKMDGRMIWNFTSFSTVFQSYQDDERLIMKGCVQWLRRFRLERGPNSRPLDQETSAEPTELSELLII